MVLQSAPEEFYVLGSGLAVSFLRDPDTDNRVAGIARIERMTDASGHWTAAERLSGDQSDQGRALLMEPGTFCVYRVKLYTSAREPSIP